MPEYPMWHVIETAARSTPQSVGEPTRTLPVRWRQLTGPGTMLQHSRKNESSGQLRPSIPARRSLRRPDAIMRPSGHALP